MKTPLVLLLALFCGMVACHANTPPAPPVPIPAPPAVAIIRIHVHNAERERAEREENVNLDTIRRPASVVATPP